MFFNNWNWFNNSRDDIINNRQSLWRDIKNKINEEQVLRDIAERTTLESTIIWSRRIILIILNVSLIGGTSFTIIQVYNNEVRITKWVNDNLPDLRQVSPFLPSLVISVINLVTPSLTKIFAKLENWDFKDTTIKNEIWRSYIAKLFNLTIFLLLNFQALFA